MGKGRLGVEDLRDPPEMRYSAAGLGKRLGDWTWGDGRRGEKLQVTYMLSLS